MRKKSWLRISMRSCPRSWFLMRFLMRFLILNDVLAQDLIEISILAQSHWDSQWEKQHFSVRDNNNNIIPRIKIMPLFLKVHNYDSARTVLYWLYARRVRRNIILFDTCVRGLTNCKMKIYAIQLFIQLLDQPAGPTAEYRWKNWYFQNIWQGYWCCFYNS